MPPQGPRSSARPSCASSTPRHSGPTARACRRETALKATTRRIIEIYGDPTETWTPVVTAHARTLAALTGLTVDARPAECLRDIRDGGHIQLHIVPRTEFAPLVAQSWIRAAWRARLLRSLCLFVTFGLGTVRAALAVIDSNLTDDTPRHCLLEELTQAFGVINDSTVMGASIFNDRGPLMTAPTEIDRLVVRVLYDPSLTSGMPRAAALAAAGTVFDELVGAR